MTAEELVKKYLDSPSLMEHESLRKRVDEIKLNHLGMFTDIARIGIEEGRWQSVEDLEALLKKMKEMK